MATPVLVAALIFYYLPMFGIRYAFFTYKGINDPIFVGMKHFVKMFSMPGFWKAFSNTLVLSITKLILNTGAAVIISVLLNELIFLKLKKVMKADTVKCSFYNNSIMIAVRSEKDFFELGSLFKNVSDLSTIENFYRDISIIFELIEYFKLDVKIGL